MKKILFIIICLAIVGLMTVVSNELDWGFGDKNDEFCVAFAAIILAVNGVANQNNMVRGLFMASGLLSTIWFLGGEATLVYLFGCIIILIFMHRFPEVEEMVAKLWTPDHDEDDEEK